MWPEVIYKLFFNNNWILIFDKSVNTNENIDQANIQVYSGTNISVTCWSAWKSQNLDILELEFFILCVAL